MPVVPALIRTALFVPGNRPERIDKAVTTAADAVIIDLEDAVPCAAKCESRQTVRQKLAQYPDRLIYVRINDLGSEFARGDLEALVCNHLAGIMLPKVETAAEIAQINELLSDYEQRAGAPRGNTAVIPLIESALAVENAFQIAAAQTDPARVFTLAFGAADFSFDMGIELTRSGEELSYARARLAIACRAAQLPPPLDTPFMMALGDPQALEADARRAKQLGFQGKLCIHPDQIDVCHTVFSPTEQEIEYARKVMEAFKAAEESGSAAIKVDGRFVDYAVVKRAKSILRFSQWENSSASEST